MSETRKLAAILVADVVGYSRLAGALSPRIKGRNAESEFKRLNNIPLGAMDESGRSGIVL